MQRTGLKANIPSRLSNDRNSAGLNFSELQQGHSRLIHSRRGAHAGHVRIQEFISIAPRTGPHVVLQCTVFPRAGIGVQPRE
jgi:hypothetical protein